MRLFFLLGLDIYLFIDFFVLLLLTRLNSAGNKLMQFFFFFFFTDGDSLYQIPFSKKNK